MSKDAVQVVSIVARDPRGFLLYGKRNDNGKWTLPGGHLEEDERPVRGAIRELMEETGLKPVSNMRQIADEVIKDGQLRVIVFECDVDGKPTGSMDPDEECSEWHWLDEADEEQVADLLGNLHSPKNVALKAVGVQPSEKTDDLICNSCGSEPGCNIDCDECNALFKALLPKIAMGGLLAFGSAHATPSAQEKAPATDAPPSKPWTPEGLTPELHPIAHIESSFGQNVSHLPHSKGSFHTAVGAVGLKPVTAHEEYTKSPALQSAFPGLQNPEDFQKQLATDHQLYNKVASSHWERLKKRFGTPERAAYAWRRGWGTAAKAEQSQIDNDPYVQRFKELSAAPAKKREEIALKKGEGDELSKLLNHPNPVERRIALKMAGVQPDHLCDLVRRPEMIAAALGHPAADASVLHEVIDGPKSAPWGQIVKHPAFDADHAEKIAAHILGGRAPVEVAGLLAANEKTGPDAIQQLIPHLPPQLAAELLLHPASTEQDYRNFWTPYVQGAIPAPDMAGAVGRAFIDPRMPSDLLEKLARRSSELNVATGKDFADTAFRHPKLPPQYLDRLISQVMVRPDFDSSLLEAIKNPALSPQHHDMLQRARNPVIRALAVQADADALSKAFKDSDFTALTSRSHMFPIGEAPVDHRVMEDANPPEVDHLKQHFLRHQVQEQVHEPHYKSSLPDEQQTSSSQSKHGISPKLHYITKDAQGKERQFLIKPFHEKASNGMEVAYPHPTAGWAELTSQALYHAGGIGHLHSKSHLVEHEGYPAIAVHFEDGVVPAHQLDWHDKKKPTPESTKHDIRHIALMDFLTGNYDRHGNNLMANKDRTKVLAIDHGLAFQYKKPEVTTAYGQAPAESFNEVYHEQALPHYTGDKQPGWGPVSGNTNPAVLPKYDVMQAERAKTNEQMAPALAWWKKNAMAIRSKFDEHLGAVKDEKLRDHIHQNFHARASVLDRAARGIEPTFLGRNVHWTDVQHPIKGMYAGVKKMPAMTQQAEEVSQTKTTPARSIKAPPKAPEIAQPQSEPATQDFRRKNV